MAVRSSQWGLLPLALLGMSGCQTAPTAVLPLQTTPPPGISQFIETASFDVEDGSLVVSGKRAFKSGARGERVDTLNLKDLDLQVSHHRGGATCSLGGIAPSLSGATILLRPMYEYLSLVYLKEVKIMSWL